MTGRVPRETRAVAAAVFGERLPAAVEYARLLGTAAVERGLIGPREARRLWDRHILNCAVVVPALPRTGSIADVGSGAGLPGVVWALCRPHADFTLIDSSERRAQFLREVVHRLELAQVAVVRARAEDLHGSLSFDVVTARAVAPLARLVPWCLPLVAPGGALLAFKGRTAAAEVATLGATHPAMNATSTTVATYGEGMVEPRTTVVVITRTGPEEASR